jgi:hypothetical protein
LKKPPALSAHQFAISGKRGLIDSLVSLQRDQQLKGITLGDIKIPGIFLKVSNEDVTLDTYAVSKPEDIVDGDLLEVNVANDEGRYFSAGVSAIDNTISLMRLVEGRVAAYSKVLEDANAVRASLAEWLAKADARLRTIEVEIAEARHDVSVATALQSEEQARIEALNNKRAAILRDVKVLVFRRPRTVDRVTVIPATAASPANVEQPVTACLRAHPGAPDELRQMAEGFRNAPVSWFPGLTKLIDLFDRPEAMAAALIHVWNRAVLTAPLAATAPVFAGPKYLMAVNKALFSRSQSFASKRLAGLALEPSRIHEDGFVASRNRFNTAALLGDLIDSGHGRVEASRRAAEELDRISQTAACLHASFAETPPIVRLAWAETLSEFDAPVPLRSLTALPGWQALPADMRREQQGLADFLYSRIDAANAEATAAIDELIRVALLMAAHAPVDKLVAARIARPATASPGVLLDLHADLSQIRIGMAVTVQASLGGVLARAVIEDVAGGVAKARIIESANRAAIIDGAAIVHLSETDTPKIAMFPIFLGKR